MTTDSLKTYIEFATVLVRRDRLLHHEFMERARMATPAAITKLTEQASRAKAMMADTEKTGEAAGPILDAYDEAHQRFKAHMSEVKQNTRDLNEMLHGFGNATQILDGAFQDEKSMGAAETSSVNEQQANNGEVPGDGGAPKSGG